MKTIIARLLLGLISIGGMLCSCQENIDWKEKPSASDLQFVQLAKSWDEGTVQTDEQEITYHQPGWNGFYYDVNVRWKQKGKKLYGVWNVSSSLSSDKASEETLQALVRGVASDYSF